ncbi:DNA-directed RNA polymerase III subunit RPC8 [Entamoeba marina]
MYIVTHLVDSFKIPPARLDHILQCVIGEINSKYQNKMIEGKGIGVMLYDIEKIHDGVIQIGTGDVYYDVAFNYVVFKPFQGEVIEGKVLRSLSSGIQVTLGFTDSVFIDQCYFPYGCDFDEEEQLWYWGYGESKLFMHVDAAIKFRVHHVAMKKREDSDLEVKEEGDASTTPLVVHGQINESGLGMVIWWKS